MPRVLPRTDRRSSAAHSLLYEEIELTHGGGHVREDGGLCGFYGLPEALPRLDLHTLRRLGRDDDTFEDGNDRLQQLHDDSSAAPILDFRQAGDQVVLRRRKRQHQPRVRSGHREISENYTYDEV